jgi:hypothetical protein
MLLGLSPAQLDAACTAIACTRQPEPGAGGCISQAGALQVAAYYGIPVADVARWDWAEIDAHLWAGVVIHQHYGNPDGIAHSYYCQGDVWVPALQLRAIHCWDAANPAGTWWAVPYLQKMWTGWGAVRTR